MYLNIKDKYLWIYVVIGFIFFGQLFYRIYRDDKNTERRAKKASAVITYRENGKSVVIKYEYFVNGIKYKGGDVYSTLNKNINEGDTVRIIYDSISPQQSIFLGK
jgi:hypothetical protein